MVDPTESGVSAPLPMPVAPRTWRGWVLRSAGQMLLLFSVYTLSIGPMFWTWYSAMYLDGPVWVAKLYLPLVIACEVIPPFGWLVNQYINWWIL
jgi:hypothetical protein